MRRVIIGLISATALTGVAFAQAPAPAPAPTSPTQQTAPPGAPTVPPASRPAPTPVPEKLTDVWKGTGTVAYYNANANDVGSAQLIGLTIYNEKQETVGKVADLILDEGKTLKALVIGVGGFLGLGERWVAVEPGSVTIAKTENGKFRGIMNVTAEELKKAPEFKYVKPAETAKTN